MQCLSPVCVCVCVCVVLSITVCHAFKLMPTGCLHMMGCVRPPKSTAGGPTGMSVYSRGVFVECVCVCVCVWLCVCVCVYVGERETDSSSEVRGWGVVKRTAFLKKLWLQANQNWERVRRINRKRRIFPLLCHVLFSKAGKFLFLLKS